MVPPRSQLAVNKASFKSSQLPLPFWLLQQIDMYTANRTNFQNGEHVFRRSILINALKVRHLLLLALQPTKRTCR